MTDGCKVWKMCTHCGGAGEVERPGAEGSDVVECETCDGTGYIFWGWMSKDDYALPEGLPDPPE